MVLDTNNKMEVETSMKILKAVSLVVFCTCCLLVTACGDNSKSDPVIPEIGGSKADLIDRVDICGELKFDELTFGAFNDDFQFDAYTFNAKADVPVTVSITQAGTSRDLDTTLFLYGPEGDGYTETFIAQDDDSGWGTFSKIEMTLPNEGGYLVVIGTVDALGRGTYGILLECGQTDCGLEVPPVADECPEEFFEELNNCVGESQQDLNFSESFYNCTSESDYKEKFEWVCDELLYEFCSIDVTEAYNTFHEVCDQEILDFWVWELEITQTCDETVYDALVDCVQTELDNQIEQSQAIMDCTSGDKPTEFFENICQQDDPADWCIFGQDVFNEGIFQDCVEAIGDEIF
jgi:hypothetical protein